MVDPFAALALITALILAGATRLQTCVRAISVQALSLMGVCLAVGIEFGGSMLFISAVAVLLGVRAWLIRVGFRRIIMRLNVRGGDETRPGFAGTMALTTLLVGIAYSVARPLSVLGLPRSEGYVAVAVSLLLVGLLVMVTRHRAVAQVMGLLMMEHGVLLMSMSTVTGLPFIIEFGLYMDALIAAILSGLLWYRVDDALERLPTGVPGGPDG